MACDVSPVAMFLTEQPSFSQSFFYSITQVSSFSARSEAVDEAAESGNTPMGVVALHAWHVSSGGLKVSCSNE